MYEGRTGVISEIELCTEVLDYDVEDLDVLNFVAHRKMESF